MKVLFLTLLLGVVCAAQEEEAEQSVSELSGEWKTVYFGSTGTEMPADPASSVSGTADSVPETTTASKITRIYVCKVVFNSDEGTVVIYLCVELNGKWRNVKVTGKKEDDNTYVFEYNGTKRLKVAYLSDAVLILCVFNVDKDSGETPCAVILAVKVSVNQEVIDIFNKLISEKGIKEDNVVNLIEYEDCPPCALLETRTTSPKCP